MRSVGDQGHAGLCSDMLLSSGPRTAAGASDVRALLLDCDGVIADSDPWKEKLGFLQVYRWLEVEFLSSDVCTLLVWITSTTLNASSKSPWLAALLLMRSTSTGRHTTRSSKSFWWMPFGPRSVSSGTGGGELQGSQVSGHGSTTK